MNILIQNADIITLDDQNHILRQTDLAISDETIVSVEQTPIDFTPDEIVEGYDHVIQPAFYNAHTHAPMALERGWAEDLPSRWLNEKIWVAESALTPDDVYWGAALAACEMIRGGTVGFADHYFWMDQVAQVASESGMKALLAWCLLWAQTRSVAARWSGRSNSRSAGTTRPRARVRVTLGSFALHA
jgi:5-methylthioadenosine/S-adenosylhomocysteine deaminase